MQSPVPSWFHPRSTNQALFLRLLLFGAPLALALSFLLHETPGHHAAFHIPIDRQKVIRAAHQTASRLHLDTRGWSEHVSTHANPDMVDYFRLKPLPQSLRARSFAGELGANVMLSEPGGGTHLNVTFAADGTELAYRIGGKDLRPAEPLAEDEMLALATLELQSLVSELSMEALGAAEISVSEAAGVAGVRRVTFRPFSPDAPDIEYSVSLDFLGPRIIAREIRAEASEMFTGRFLRQSRSLRAYGNLLRTALLIAFCLYAGLNFSRRIADREAPVLRAIALTAVAPAFGVVLYLSDPALFAGALKPESFTAAGLIAGLLGRLFNLSLQGMFMGIGYGGAESYLREAFPGKLVSLDAVLKGRIFSANAGQAVITGAAIGCWLVLAYHLLLPLTGNPVNSTILVNTTIALSKHPWSLFFLKSVVVTLFVGSISLLVPLLIFRRLAHRPLAMALALLATALLIGTMDEPSAPDAPDFWLRSFITALTLIGAFFFWDFLAALTAWTTLSLLAPLADMLDRMPAWHSALPFAVAAAGGTLLPMLVAAIRGRRYEEKELLPRYARVQAERLSLQAELSAAREAQLRLLPAVLPEVAGLSLAASCTPAREVGGDFYDFIQLDDGSLGIIVAEGGNDGLASALTIALAKGFLLFESAAFHDLSKTLCDLENALGENLQRSSGRTAIALLLVNPADRSVSIARAGDFPHILALSASGSTREASLLEDSASGIARGALTLDPGDSLLIYTDGLAWLARQRNQGDIDAILRKAAGFSATRSASSIHGVILDSLLTRERKIPHDLADDITAVVVTFTGAAAGARQEVA
jgi:serine phosphatase RsbU (regulator of sigma subunit)